MTTHQRLTGHQSNILRKIIRTHARTDQPVRESDIGSRGAVLHLEAKGWIRLAKVEYGARGREVRYWVPSESAWVES